jgi:hypothetical protein
MAARGWLTDEQAHIVTRYLLDLPPWTNEDEDREQTWLDRQSEDALTRVLLA